MERCKYCVAEGETLLSKMRLFTPDMNWLRLWAVNGADDGLSLYLFCLTSPLATRKCPVALSFICALSCLWFYRVVRVLAGFVCLSCYWPASFLLELSVFTTGIYVIFK